MEKTEIKKVVKLSWIYDSARAEFEMMKQMPDLDASFFTEDELEHYVGVIIKSHLDDWLVVNDIDNERTV